MELSLDLYLFLKNFLIFDVLFLANAGCLG